MIPDILSDKPLPSEGITYNNLISIEVTSDVATEPVTLAEAKAHLRVDFTQTDNDNDITRLKKVARIQVENQVNKGFGARTLKVGIRNDKGNFKLPFGPVTSITNVKDVDQVTLDTSAYSIKNGILETPFTTPVFVTYVTGYTTTPEEYKQMILERLAYLYNNRGDIAKNNIGTWLV
jgi:uncharacterized phiE125 gp8 family phage protein